MSEQTQVTVEEENKIKEEESKKKEISKEKTEISDEDKLKFKEKHGYLPESISHLKKYGLIDLLKKNKIKHKYYWKKADLKAALKKFYKDSFAKFTPISSIIGDVKRLGFIFQIPRNNSGAMILMKERTVHLVVRMPPLTTFSEAYFNRNMKESGFQFKKDWPSLLFRKSFNYRYFLDEYDYARRASVTVSRVGEFSKGKVTTDKFHMFNLYPDDSRICFGDKIFPNLKSSIPAFYIGPFNRELVPDSYHNYHDSCEKSHKYNDIHDAKLCSHLHVTRGSLCNCTTGSSVGNTCSNCGSYRVLEHENFIEKTFTDENVTSGCVCCYGEITGDKICTCNCQCMCCDDRCRCLCSHFPSEKEKMKEWIENYNPPENFKENVFFNGNRDGKVYSEGNISGFIIIDNKEFIENTEAPNSIIYRKVHNKELILAEVRIAKKDVYIKIGKKIFVGPKKQFEIF